MTEDPHRVLDPHWSDVEKYSWQIRHLIADAVKNMDRDKPSTVDEDIAKIIHRAVMVELDRFQERSDRLEQQLREWRNRPPPPSPPWRELLKRYIVHVAEKRGTPLITSIGSSSVGFTQAERVLLMELEMEGRTDNQRQDVTPPSS